MGKPWENGDSYGKSPGKNGWFYGISIEIENGPVEIVDLPMKNGDFPELPGLGNIQKTMERSTMFW